jgi:hypothetical protein
MPGPQLCDNPFRSLIALPNALIVSFLPACDQAYAAGALVYTNPIL